ncbi:transmembrane protein, putative (macronuclear) [Tetrahymena thermophila SB210]|uniref:Transmembrane protein, putative n=1 Tax=Tetrahymena thermophila (strain SB210) TaxID=312017 RepID=I7M0B8_TETTS|nr:transmembrane protein, putative [Tetrahymena thermophila SB210]EAR87273.1 transmembrane protein, putative [Tetrahymena thermophila SB210]|eukprot:XP_001007518.1 transmembrane protein, putative [Tetrahymena thermophila SB210]
MSTLKKPLKDETNLAQNAFKNQKESQMDSKLANPFQVIYKIENINANIKMDENGSEKTILKIMLMISFLFQISSFVLIILNVQLRLLGLESESKIIGIEFTYSLLSLLSFITYIYSLNEIDHQGLQSLSKLFKISLLFALLTLVLGICVFGIVVNEDLSCYAVQKGIICNKINLQNTTNSSDQECLVKLPSNICDSNSVTGAVKYTILILSGVPLILIFIVNFKFYRYCQRLNTSNQNQQNLDNSSSQKLISNPDIEDKSQQYITRGKVNPFKIDSTTKKSFLFAQQNISAQYSANNISNDQL